MKYYFESEDAEMCYSESYFQELIKERELTEIEVFKAERITNSGFFFCRKFMEVDEVNGTCGKHCSKYIPRNGKSGRCKYSGYVYENIGEKVTLKLKP